MSTRWTAVITSAGLDLLADVQGRVFNFTRAQCGAGYVDVPELENQTAVSDFKKNLGITSISTEENVTKLRLQLSNTSIATSFNLYQIGVFAKLDNDPEDVLFMIIQADTPDYIPSESESPNFVNDYLVNVIVGNADSVSGNIDVSAYVTLGLFDEKFHGISGHNHNGQPGNGPLIGTDGIQDDAIGNEQLKTFTVDHGAVPETNTGKPASIFSWLANRIKAITGKADWKTAPRTTLENVVKLDGDTMTGNLQVPTINELVTSSFEREVYQRQETSGFTGKGLLLTTVPLTGSGISRIHIFTIKTHRSISSMNIADEIKVMLHVRNSGGTIFYRTDIFNYRGIIALKFYIRIVGNVAEFYVITQSDHSSITVIDNGRSTSDMLNGTAGLWSNFDGTLPGDVEEIIPLTLSTKQVPTETTVTSGFPSGWTGQIRYRKNQEGLVTVYIDLERNVDISAGVTTLFTLPVGFRPAFHFYNLTNLFQSNGVTSTALSNVGVNAAGELMIYTVAGTNLAGARIVRRAILNYYAA